MWCLKGSQWSFQTAILLLWCCRLWFSQVSATFQKTLGTFKSICFFGLCTSKRVVNNWFVSSSQSNVLVTEVPSSESNHRSWVISLSMEIVPQKRESGWVKCILICFLFGGMSLRREKKIILDLANMYIIMTHSRIKSSVCHSIVKIHIQQLYFVTQWFGALFESFELSLTRVSGPGGPQRAWSPALILQMRNSALGIEMGTASQCRASLSLCYLNSTPPPAQAWVVGQHRALWDHPKGRWHIFAGAGTSWESNPG